MKFEVMNFLNGSMYKFDTFDTTYTDSYLNFSNINPFIGLDCSVNFGLENNHKYVLVIDNGTQSMGVVIADVTVRGDIAFDVDNYNTINTNIGLPLYMMNVLRTLNDGSNDSLYASKLVGFIDGLLRRVDSNGNKLFTGVIMESPFYNKKAGWSSVRSYEVLQYVLKLVKEVCNNNNINFIKVAPQSWKSKYLGPFKSSMKLNLTSSNKSAILKVGLMYINQFPQMNSVFGFDEGFFNFKCYYMNSKHTDLFDAFGLYIYYNDYIYRSDSIKKIAPSLPKYNGKFIRKCYLFRDKADKDASSSIELIEIIRNGLNAQRKHDIPLLQFEYCTDNMSVDDNVRAALSYGDNLCISYTPLTIKLLPELYDYEFGSVNKNSYVLVIGYML